MTPESDQKQLFPILMTLQDARVVVIGGGRVALRKVQSLLSCGASVELVSPHLCDGLLELAGSGRIQVARRTYRPGDLSGAVLAIAAVDDAGIGAEVAAEASRQGIPVNVVDKPELCTFIVPSILRRGPLTVAVSTGGASPAWARQIRENLERDFGPEYSRLFTALQSIRNRCRREIPDPGRRRDILERLADPQVLELARSTSPDGLAEAIWAFLGHDE
jgi:siroheme synthase-like protein